jgi:uncharacterized protein YjbJ (UPF0337 family)
VQGLLNRKRLCPGRTGDERPWFWSNDGANSLFTQVLRSGPRIGVFDDLGGRALLLDNRKPGAAVDDPLDISVLVTDGNDEKAGVRPDGLVDLERHVNPLGARLVGAFADETSRLQRAVMASGEVPDLLVDRTEKCFVRSRSVVLDAHRPRVTRNDRVQFRVVERKEVLEMGDRTQRLKGKANEIAGKTKGTAGYATRSPKTQATGAAQVAKGKAQQAVGKARSAAKKGSR